MKSIKLLIEYEPEYYRSDGLSKSIKVLKISYMEKDSQVKASFGKGIVIWNNGTKMARYAVGSFQKDWNMRALVKITKSEAEEIIGKKL